MISEQRDPTVASLGGTVVAPAATRRRWPTARTLLGAGLAAALILPTNVAAAGAAGGTASAVIGAEDPAALTPIPGLAARPYGDTAMEVSWAPGVDVPSGVEFVLLRDGAEVFRGPELSHFDTGLSPSTSYEYQVQAYFEGQLRAQSEEVTATTEGVGVFSEGALLPAFEPSGIDGAGFQNVIAVSPLEPNKLLLGGDVAGINHSTDRGEQWYGGNEGLYRPEQLHIGDVEWSPTVRDKGYMCASWKGGGGGFYVTTDAGQSWTLRNSQAACHGGLTTEPVLPYPHPRSTGNLMAIDASNGYIYLGTWNKGVMRSVDDGRTWTTLGLSGKYLRGIALDAANPQVLYVAAANEGVYVTTSARGTGSLALLAGSPKTPEELAIVNNVLWVAAGTAGVFKATGSGGSRTFSKAPLATNGETSYYTVTGYKPSGSAAVLYVGNFKGPKVGTYNDNMSKSTDGGATWQSITLDPSKIDFVPWGGTEPWWLTESEPCFRIGKPCYVASQIVIDPANPQIVYATGRSGVWRSDNGGENWRPAVRGIGATITRGAAVEASGDNVFVALADYVLVQSSDNGVNFKKNKPPLGNVGYGVAVDPRGPNPVVYVAAGERDTNTEGDLWRNDNPFGGGAWVSEGIGAKVGNKRIMGVALVPKDGGGRILFAAVDGGGLWRKEDNGAWAKVSSEISATAATGGNSRRVVRGVSASNGVFYAYDPYRGVYRSTDLGLTWERIWAKASVGDFTGFMSVDPQNPGTLYVAPGDSVYRIDGADKGTVGSGLTAVNLNVPRPGPVYVASDRSVWTVQQVTQAEPATLLRSTDRGASWVRVDDPVWRGQVAVATGLAFNTGDGDTAKGRAFVTTDGTGMLIAKFVRSGTPYDLEQPTAVMQRPAEGTTLPQGETLTVSGTASDNVGVTGVDVVILRYDDEVQGFLQADGSFGGEQGARLPATLSNPGETTTNWTFSTALPGGSYYALALARDAAGNETIDVPVRGFAVLSPGGEPDTTAPTVSVVTPADAGEYTGGAETVFAGAAADNAGVTRVGVAIQRLSDRLWLRPDGSFGAYNQQPAQLAAPGSASTEWTFPVELPAGEYGFRSQSEDAAGNRSQNSAWRTFSITETDTAAPEIAVTAPVPSAYVPSNAVELAGRATDAIGVAKVGVAVQRLSDKLWLRPDGSFGAYNQQAAVLGSPDGPSTSWALTTELPPGTYGIHAAATDTSGNKSPNSPWRTFTVFTQDDTAPALTMDEPVAGQQYAPGEDVVISGTASDNVGAAYVALGIQRGSDDNWLQPDGTWGPPAYLLAELSSPGATGTGWTYSVALDPDEYAVQAVSLDAAGNISAPTGSRGFEVVAPDTTAPQLSVQAPQEGQEFLASEAVHVTGTASDGVGVTGVGVSIQRASDDNYLQPDGSWGAAAMLDADLSSPGGPSTDWSVSAALEPDTYLVQAVATDAAGNMSQPSAARSLSVIDPLVPDIEVPQITVSVPTQDQAFPSSGQVTVSGSASDNVAVAGAGVAIQRQSDKRWLRPNGTWGAYIQQGAELSDPGATSTDWAFPVTLPPGNYGVQTAATDEAGNKSAVSPWRRFSVAAPPQEPPSDTEGPVIDVALPADGQVLPAGQLWLVGTATDNVKVTGATAAVQRASDKKWLTSRGGWTRSRNDLEAAIAFDASGMASWYLSATLKVGSYAVAATAIDAAGNASEAAGPLGFRVE